MHSRYPLSEFPVNFWVTLVPVAQQLGVGSSTATEHGQGAPKKGRLTVQDYCRSRFLSKPTHQSGLLLHVPLQFLFEIW